MAEWGLFLHQAEYALAQSLNPLTTDREIRGAMKAMSDEKKAAIKRRFALDRLAEWREPLEVVNRLYRKRNRLLLAECERLGIACEHRVEEDLGDDLSSPASPSIVIVRSEVKLAQQRVLDAQMWAHVDLFDSMVAPLRGILDRGARLSKANNRSGWPTHHSSKDDLDTRWREAERIRNLEAEERERTLLEKAKEDAGGAWGNSWASRSLSAYRVDGAQPRPANAHGQDTEREEEGFEALQRLYQEALSDAEGCGAICAKLLVGLYNGPRYRFNLTSLRQLPASLLADALSVIEMDAALTRKEVHQYFEDGGKKFRDLIHNYSIEDVERLRESGDGRPIPRAEPGKLNDGAYVSAKLVSTGSAPGYRDVRMVLDCSLVGTDAEHLTAPKPVRIELGLGPADGQALMEHIQEVHRFAWGARRERPLDAKEGEPRPRWIDSE